MKREGDVLKPVRLISIGLTNHPNIPGDAIANQEIIAADGGIIPVAIGTNSGEMSAEEGERKKSRRGRKSREKVAAKNEPDPTEWDRQILRGVNRLLKQLLAVDLNQPLGEIESRLMAIIEQAHLWRNNGEALKNSNGELTSESERFYRIACEKERSVKELTEQFRNEKDRSGEHFVNFAVSRGLILPNESTEWKEKYGGAKSNGPPPISAARPNQKDFDQ
jgi:hypothetical protein